MPASPMNAQQQAIQAAIANQQARSFVLKNFIPYQQYLGNFSSGCVAGGNTRIKGWNLGIATGLKIRVNIAYTTATAAPTLSPKAPFNLISRLQTLDYANVSRFNLSGFETWLFNSVRARQAFGVHNGGMDGAATVFQAGPIARLQAAGSGTAGAVAVGANTASAYLEVPIAFDHSSDLTGAMFVQTNNGDWFLSIDWRSTGLVIGSDAEDYFSAANGGTVTGGTQIWSVDVWQTGYLLPDNSSPLPQIDLTTVYEVQGGVRLTDLTAGSERIINYPVNRTVIGAHLLLQNQGALGVADLSRMRVILNSASYPYAATTYDKLLEQRLWMSGCDTKAGHWFKLHRDHPIDTAQYGQVQLGITPANFTPASNSYLSTTWESFYRTGTPLPGITQG